MKKLHEASTSDITPADKANDRHSLLRNTPGFLYLLIDTPAGWSFPSVEFDESKYKSTREVASLFHLSILGSGKTGRSDLRQGSAVVLLGIPALCAYSVFL